MNYIGYFGKLPEKGDFIQHGIDMAEKDAWDAWIQDGIVSAREALAGAWSAAYAYRTAWRFLASGPDGQRCGVLLLSHDRVGREFPFVVLYGHAMDPVKAPQLAVGDVDASLSFAERLVAAAYDGSVPVDQLATLLQHLPWRTGAAEALRDSDGSLSSFTPAVTGRPLTLEAVLLQAAIGDDAGGEPRSLWWRCAGSDGLERVVLNRGALTSRLFGQLLAAGGTSVLPAGGRDPATQPLSEAEATDTGAPAPQPVSGVKPDPADEDPVDFNSLLG